MATSSNDRPSWYKIGNKLFSESGHPIIIDAPQLATIQDFAVTDTPAFHGLLQTAKEFKMLPSIEGSSISNLTYKLQGRVSETETHCRTTAVPKSALEDFNILRGLLESPSAVNMTALYREVAKFELAIPEFSKASRRVCDVSQGVAFVGTKNYIEFNNTTLSKPPGEELFLKEMFDALGTKYLDQEDAEFFHIIYLKKKFLIVKTPTTAIFLDQKPSIQIPSEAVFNYINKVKASPDKKLAWVINSSTHRDIRSNIAGMHKLMSGDKLDKIVLNSLESKPKIVLKLKEDIPLVKLSFSVLTPFENALRSDQKIEIYEVPKMMEDGKPVYHIIYYIDKQQKTRKKDAVDQPVWEIEKNAILTP